MQSADVDEKNLKISFPVASERPYRRFDDERGEYLEVLKCDAASIDFERLNGGASVLQNHDSDKILGVVEKAWVDEARLWVRVAFRQANATVRNIFADIAAGLMPNVSIGYEQNMVRFDGEFGFVERWTPLEVSMAVGVPADPSVGVYRCHSNPTMKVRNMEEEKQPAETPAEEVKNAPEPDPGAESERLKELKAEVEALKAECEALKAKAEDEKPEENPGKKECSGDEEKARAIANVAGHPEVYKRGMTAKDVTEKLKTVNFNMKEDNSMVFKNYSDYVATAVRMAVGIEKDNSKIDAVRTMEDKVRYGASDKRSVVINTMVRENEFIGGSGNNGAALIGTEHKGDWFVEALRARMGVRDFTTMFGLRQNVEIPVQTGTLTPQIAALNGALTNQQPNTDKITLSPKKFGAKIVVGEDLVAQATPDAINLVINDGIAQIARQLDYCILKGNASPAIAGLDGTSGVKQVAIANIANATYKDILKFFGQIGGYDLKNIPAWVMSIADMQTFKGIAKNPSGGSRFVLEDGQMDGFAVNVSGMISSGDIYLGNWADVIVAEWGGLQIQIDPYSAGDNGQVVIRMKRLMDIGIRNPNGFVKRVASISSSSSN